MSGWRPEDPLERCKASLVMPWQILTQRNLLLPPHLQRGVRSRQHLRQPRHALRRHLVAAQVQQLQTAVHLQGARDGERRTRSSVWGRQGPAELRRQGGAALNCP